MLRTVHARIRDGHFQYYVYEAGPVEKGQLPFLYLSDQYPKEIRVYLGIAQDLHFDDGHTITPCSGITPQGFAQLFFPEYATPIDPDYEAWWDGVIVEL